MEDRRKMEEHQHKPHRHSFHLLRKRGSERSLERSKAVQQREARLELEIESPPLVFYGQPSQSSGALLSGQLKVFVDAPAAGEEMEVEGLEMRFVLDYNCKKPFHVHCPECAKQTVVCTSWKFVQGPTKLAKGMLQVQSVMKSEDENNWLTIYDRRTHIPLLFPPSRPPSSIDECIHGINRLQPPSDPHTCQILLNLLTDHTPTFSASSQSDSTIRNSTPIDPHFPTHQPYRTCITSIDHPPNWRIQRDFEIRWYNKTLARQRYPDTLEVKASNVEAG